MTLQISYDIQPRYESHKWSKSVIRKTGINLLDSQLTGLTSEYLYMSLIDLIYYKYLSMSQIDQIY